MEKQTVEMTLQEKEEFEAFQAEKKEREKQAQQQADRTAYKELVDETIRRIFPSAKTVSFLLGAIKKRIYDEFNDALSLKNKLYGVKEGQQSHMFTSSDGKIRFILGYNVTDNYDDTVNEGIKKVSDYISSLAKDEDTRTLVSAILRLLAKDGNTGTLKASRVLQLRKMAEDSRNAEFLDGVRIIEDAYLPVMSKQYVKVQYKDEYNEWQNVSLGMTEAKNIDLNVADYSKLIDSVNQELLTFIYKSNGQTEIHS